jgi:hypothetical protein
MNPDYEFERATANDDQLARRRARGAAERPVGWTSGRRRRGTDDDTDK